MFSWNKKLETLDDAALMKRRDRDYALINKIRNHTTPNKMAPVLMIFGASIGLLTPFLPLAAVLVVPLILGAAVVLAVATTVGIYKAAQREMKNIDAIEERRETVPFVPEPTPALANAADLSNEFRNGTSGAVAVRTLRLNVSAHPTPKV